MGVGGSEGGTRSDSEGLINHRASLDNSTWRGRSLEGDQTRWPGWGGARGLRKLVKEVPTQWPVGWQRLTQPDQGGQQRWQSSWSELKTWVRTLSCWPVKAPWVVIAWRSASLSGSILIRLFCKDRIQGRIKDGRLVRQLTVSKCFFTLYLHSEGKCACRSCERWWNGVRRKWCGARQWGKM